MSKDYKVQMIELFKKWHEEQIIEDENSYSLTQPNLGEREADYNRFKNSFVADGCIDYDQYYQSDKKVLFILKEPAICNRNNPAKPHLEAIENQIDNHWFKALMEKGGAEDKKYYDRFNSIIETLGVNQESVALMNINKRGGSGATDDKRLFAYLSHYENRIKDEIKLLNPTIIISCIGTGKTSKQLFDLNNNDYISISYANNKTAWCFLKTYNGAKVYGMYHPASRPPLEEYKTIFKILIEK